MKYLVLLFLLLTGFLYPQIDVRAGMGIYFISTPSLRDYLNQNYRSGEEYPTFNSAISFSGESDYFFSPSFAAGLEINYILNSFTFMSEIGKRELTYNFIMPTAAAYYVISGSGYNFKLGGGAGVRFTNVDESTSFASRSYSTTGIGFLIKADGNTLLGGNLYANVGTDLRYDMNGKYNVTDTGQEIKLDALSFGIRLGVTYVFL